MIKFKVIRFKVVAHIKCGDTSYALRFETSTPMGRWVANPVDEIMFDRRLDADLFTADALVEFCNYDAFEGREHTEGCFDLSFRVEDFECFEEFEDVEEFEEWTRANRS